MAARGGTRVAYATREEILLDEIEQAEDQQVLIGLFRSAVEMEVAP